MASVEVTIRELRQIDSCCSEHLVIGESQVDLLEGVLEEDVAQQLADEIAAFVRERMKVVQRERTKVVQMYELASSE